MTSAILLLIGVIIAGVATIAAALRGLYAERDRGGVAHDRRNISIACAGLQTRTAELVLIVALVLGALLILTATGLHFLHRGVAVPLPR